MKKYLSFFPLRSFGGTTKTFFLIKILSLPFPFQKVFAVCCLLGESIHTSQLFPLKAKEDFDTTQFIYIIKITSK